MVDDFATPPLPGSYSVPAADPIGRIGIRGQLARGRYGVGGELRGIAV